MKTRDELVQWANHYEFTVTPEQIERWHKAGLLPAPIRISTEGKTGSSWVYPSYAQSNLFLILTSKYRRSISALLLDVWLRSGHIDIKFIKKMLLLKVNKFVDFFEQNPEPYDKLEHTFYGSSESHPFSIPYANKDDNLAILSTLLDIFSPDPESAIWQYENKMDENSAGKLTSKAIGADFMHKMSNGSSVEDPSIILQAMKEVLNTASLHRAINEADHTVFEQIRQDFDVFETVVTFLKVVGPQMMTSNEFFRFISVMHNGEIHKLRPMLLLILLAFFQDGKLTSEFKKMIDVQRENIGKMQWLIRFVNHMKQHPSLRRVKNWPYFFQHCDDEIASSLQEHLESFLTIHPQQDF